MFGLTSSPSVLKVNLSCSMQDIDLKWVIEKLLHDIYADDSMTTQDCLGYTFEFYEKAKAMLLKENFLPQKWRNKQHKPSASN